MRTSLTILCLALIAISGCKDKEPKITSTLDISPEMKAYFVDYEVGTKWIYQDTLDNSNFDTIELIKREPYDTNRKGVLEKGYILHYKARKSRDFKVSVGRGIKNSFYINMYTDVTGSGAVTFENYDGEWGEWLNYYDSVVLHKKIYYKVITTLSGTQYLSGVYISKGLGVVLFNNMEGNAIRNVFQLINVEKP
ncbi:MAG: hypothetical protein J5I91_09380 [Bacteroidetes bacterium]|nr:hypothetical protein [Bacteroidota bacterium]